MSNEQPLQKSLGDVLQLVQTLGPETLASQFQEVAFDLARQQQNLEKQITQFEQKRQKWESERQQSVADIQEQSSQLSDAWLRLESERRNLCAATHTLPDQSLVNPDRTEVPRPIVSHGDNSCATDSSDNHSRGSSTPSLIEQFQLLQRESRTTGLSASRPTGSKRS